jgi:hypothetical protein
MGYTILTKTLDEIAQLMKLPDEYALIAAQYDMGHGAISFIVESAKIAGKDKEEMMRFRSQTVMDVVYSEERLGAGIDFTRVKAVILVDGKEIKE